MNQPGVAYILPYSTPGAVWVAGSRVPLSVRPAPRIPLLTKSYLLERKVRVRVLTTCAKVCLQVGLDCGRSVNNRAFCKERDGVGGIERLDGSCVAATGIFLPVCDL